MTLKKIAVFFFILFNNYVLINFFYIPALYDSLPYGYFSYFLISIIITALMMLIFPKRITNKAFIKLKEKKLLKLIITVYFLLSNLLILVFSSHALSSFFYTEYRSAVFGIILLISIFFILKYNLIRIVNASFIFFIVVFPFLFYIVFSHRELLDLSEIRLFKSFNLNIKYAILMAYISLDNFMYLFLIPFTENKSSKIIGFSNISYMILEIIEGISIVGLTGNSLKGFEATGFILYNIAPLSNFIGNFDFIYIYLITICACFKLLYGFKVVELLHYKNLKWARMLSSGIVLILSILLNLFFLYVYKYTIYYIYVLIGLISIILIFMWRNLNERA